MNPSGIHLLTAINPHLAIESCSHAMTGMNTAAMAVLTPGLVRNSGIAIWPQ